MFFNRPMIPLTILLVLGVGAITWHWSYASNRLVETLSLRNAELYTKALTEFRTLYTSEVVATVTRAGIPVTHDYATRAGAIPLPATLSMLLGERIGEASSGTTVRLYSPYPFS